MKAKKTLQNRIQGWFPKEPNIVKLQMKESPKILVTRNSLGLKIVAVLFWLFGLAGILTVALQLFEFDYLPFNFRFFMGAVAATDCVGMFIVGAGLLTAKSRWINTAIIFSIASIAIFYLLPLRPAFPLEIVAMLYLVYTRKGVSTKNVITKLPAIAMVVLVCVALFMPLASVNAQLTSIAKTEVAQVNQSSDNGNFVANVYVYQYADGDNEKDYYLVEAKVQCLERNLNYINANLSISSQDGALITFTHNPQANPSSPLAVGFGVATFYWGNPQTVFVYTSQTNIDWIEKTINPKQTEVFSVELFVHQDGHFSVDLWTQAGLDDKIFGNLWVDQLSIAEIPA